MTSTLSSANAPTSTEHFSIPFHDFGGAGATIHFAHANGFPPKCYRQFIQPFKKKFKVIGMHQRPLWQDSDPKSIKRWHQLADDLISFFDQQGLKNVIGMGHSLGASVSILAANKRPDLFSKLVIIDPPGLFGQKVQLFNTFIPLSLRKNFIPIAKISAKRKDKWESQEIVYTSFRQKKVFKRFSDESLWDLVKATTSLTNEGFYTLAYPKAWETRVYVTAPNLWKDLLKVKTPMLAIKGTEKAVVDSGVWEKWQKAQPHNDFLNYPEAGHLIPMEYPKKLADWILQRL